MLIRKATGEEMLRLWGYQSNDTVSHTARFFYRNITSGNAVFWALDNEGELIGELYVFSELDDSDFADGSTTAYLCAFRVKKEYRSRGLGSRLMDAALADLRQKGFLHAAIGVDEERNEALYRHMGFNKVIKRCFYDPCGMDDNDSPAYDEDGWWLLSKDL